MDIALWVVAGLLALLYLAVGVVKLVRGRRGLADRMPWVEDFGDLVVRFVGLCEIAGAVGLILPWATGRVPVLTPVAAACLVVLQVLAISVHVRRRETSQLGINVLLALLAAFVAVGRFADVLAA
ncbi:DoxX family protein [Isoptericola sp. NEAU-Y5]|uniref:DoxX family protein n=1 Tax=Isoptericola luteus TaxID=2879484 RepID=A0ABS7ZDB4_9MICO|nr:DoxX family protein [Isoptericola sp. NEAU-Y5]MCA5892447.1 DoxX family protein [Isoptericola sp. NEAU-Y5]